MRCVAPASFAAALAAILAAPAALPFDPPVLSPGGTWSTTVTVRNMSQQARRVHPRVRLRGSRYWGDAEGRSMRGAWVPLGALDLAAGEWREFPCVLQVPDPAPAVLEIDARGLAPGVGAFGEPWTLPLVPSSSGGGGIPVRVIGGGLDGGDPEFPSALVSSAVVRDAAGWDSLLEDLRMIPPESWGLASHGESPEFRSPFFASDIPFDPSTETLLALRTSAHSLHLWPLRFWVRSVQGGPGGGLRCRYTFRWKSVRGMVPAIVAPGSYLLVAIPRTDAPVEFVRVP